MSVTLAPNLEAIIKRKVDDGLYQDTAAALDAAVRLLDVHDKRQRLLAALAEGDIGDATLYTPELLSDIDREVDEMLRRGELPDPDVCP